MVKRVGKWPYPLESVRLFDTAILLQRIIGIRLCLLRLLGAASFKNSVDCSEYLLCRLVRDHFAFNPVLNVATAVFRACQSKRFTNKERNCFRLNFSQAHGSLFGVVDVGFRSMAQNNVSKLVTESLVRQFREGRYSNLRNLRVALNIAVGVDERNLFDAKRSKGTFCIPIWCLGHRHSLTFGLCKHKPAWLPDECGYVKLVFTCLTVRLLASKRHAKPDGLFTFADLPTCIKPSFVCVDGSWLDTMTGALQKSGKLIA